MRAKVVDAHQHFWDVRRFKYWWLTPERKVLHRNFLPEDLKPLLGQTDVQLTVAVQAHPSLAEAYWLLELASANDFMAGVVGWVDLAGHNVGKDLDKLQRYPKFKGIRHPIEAEPNDEWMLRTDVLEGLGELERRGIPFDLIIHPRHLKYLPRLREKCPRLKLVIDHIALPPIAEKKMDGWDRDIEMVAQLPDVWCKLSGMIHQAGPKDWKPSDLKPYVDHVVKQFGYDRLMFGTDWPICTLAVSYQQVIDALRVVLGPIRKEDASRVWGRSAQRFYDIR
jgi:L-fucono-1,5-lactonase